MSPAARSITIAMATLSLLGCSSWRPVPAPLPEHLTSQPEQTIRFTLANGQRLELDSPRVRQDSVIGFSPGSLRTRTAIPLDQISMAEHSRTDTGATVGAVLVGVAAVGAVVFALTACGGEETAYDLC